jgi:hypothetical protein
MDGLMLLSEAKAAGLTIMAEGNRLVIRGPKSADAVAQRLLAHKAEILTALVAGHGDATPTNPQRTGGCVDSDPCPRNESVEPGPGCPVCDSLETWQDAVGRQRCGICERRILDKGLELAERAIRLRKQSQPRKLAHQDSASCDPVGMVDVLDPESDRPVQGQLPGFSGA